MAACTEAFVYPLIEISPGSQHFSRIAANSIVTIYASHDCGPDKPFQPCGILHLVNTSSRPLLTCIPPAGSKDSVSEFRVKSFDEKTGLVELVYGRSNTAFPFSFAMHPARNRPTQYHISRKTECARLDPSGALQFQPGGNFAVLNLVLVTAPPCPPGFVLPTYPVPCRVPIEVGSLHAIHVYELTAPDTFILRGVLAATRAHHTNGFAITVAKEDADHGDKTAASFTIRDVVPATSTVTLSYRLASDTYTETYTSKGIDGDAVANGFAYPYDCVFECVEGPGGPYYKMFRRRDLTRCCVDPEGAFNTGAFNTAAAGYPAYIAFGNRLNLSA
ncbi:hypothetical protein MVEN_01176300 [Mycena venus]|uniref:Uncharacterized protein n=1 Tax=Mycena venus TaxID=2733690 RepID=A0A8H6Y5E0_9AGAR|nr:hypothetical protein MVEN_01176300 [Mycena venus]